MMTEAALAARRAYRRAWAAANPDKVKKHQERYWTKVAEKTQQERQEKQRLADLQRRGGD